jgi:hypothetical protein
MPTSKTPVAIMALLMVAIGIAVPLCLASAVTENPVATPIVPTVAPAPAALSTISILFIGVDSLEAQQPVLESLTIVEYQTEIPKYFLLTVSPDTQMSPATATAPSKTIGDYYAADARLPRQAWLTQSALRKIFPDLGTPYAEVDFDRKALLKTVHLLGSLDCMGQTQSGEAFLTLFDSLAPEAAEERLHFQGNLLQCLFVAAQKQNWSFPMLLENLGQRFFPAHDVATATAEAAPPLAQSEFSVTDTPLNPILEPTPQP